MGSTSPQTGTEAAARQAEAKARAAEAETQRVAALKEQGLDSRGLPLRPEFESIFEGDTDRLREGFRIGEFDEVSQDTRALDRITSEGLSEGPTQAAQRQLQAQALDQQRGFDDLRRGQAGAQASAQNALASQGGLSGGARERLARSGARNQLLGAQQLRGQGAQARAGILSQDEQAKRGLLGQAQAGAVQAGQFGQANRQFEAQRRQFDIGSQLDELSQKRDQDIRAFEADRKAAAAEKQADAQRASACFAEGTYLEMADGTSKKVEDIRIGDSLIAGGVIHRLDVSMLTTPEDLYNYEGVIITGGHAVLEEGRWVRVRNAKLSAPFEGTVELVYNFANELHLISAGNVIFSDLEETDDYSLSDDEALEVLNRQLHERVKSGESRQLFC